MYTTRIAPSPTGTFHLGTARTAYFNWLVARASGGKFILRIDDTDQKRSEPEYEQIIIDSMKWLDLDYDIFFRQSERIQRYYDVLNTIMRTPSGKIIWFDNCVVLQQPELPEFWHDEIMGDIKISEDDHAIAQNMVLIKSDGNPTYHLATVVDDIDYGVNYIIRGQDHVSNTPRQIAIYNLLGKPVPKYAHVGLIQNPKTGKRLSKRDGESSLDFYKQYDREAVLNFILRMGWAPMVDNKATKHINRQRAIEMFLTEGTMKSNPAKVDLHIMESYERLYAQSK